MVMRQLYCKSGANVIKLYIARYLLIFIICCCFCPWQAFPAYPNVWGQGQEPTLEWST
jgi:hypothetical protein